MKMKLQGMVLCLLGLVFFQINAVADPSTDLSQLLDGIQSMQANFIQVVNDRNGKGSQQLYGNMALQRPGKFRWNVTNPVQQTIIANHGRLWFYDPNLKQVVVRPLNRGIGEAPALLLSNAQQTLPKSFRVQPMRSPSANESWFLLRPKDRNSMFTFIKIGFLGNELHGMELQDHMGHYTQIQFQNVRNDVSLPASLFVFATPANVDVIDDAQNRR